MNEWISVEERLPDEELVFCLVCIGPYKWIYICEFSNGIWYEDNGPRVFGVTHWMPLPEPPDNHAPSDCAPTGHNIESEPGR